jgi:hypothetical protein
VQGAKGDTGAQGPKGDTGATGSQGPIGPSDAFSVERADDVTVPVALTTMLTLANVPAGKYVVFANITVDNLNSPGTVPVTCYLVNPSVESSPGYGARLDPYNASGPSDRASGANVQTIAVTFTTQLDTSGDINLVCLSNTGTLNQTAQAGSRQITAIKVGSLVENDLAP